MSKARATAVDEGPADAQRLCGVDDSLTRQRGQLGERANDRLGATSTRSRPPWPNGEFETTIPSRHLESRGVISDSTI
jgi:hypothetical protein